jgi:hypothetical protein
MNNKRKMKKKKAVPSSNKGSMGISFWVLVYIFIVETLWGWTHSRACLV